MPIPQVYNDMDLYPRPKYATIDYPPSTPTPSARLTTQRGGQVNSSSPLKYAPIKVTGRKDIERSAHAHADPDLKFVRNHLPSNFKHRIFKFGKQKELVDAIRDTTTKSANLATPLATLLTKWSSLAFKRLPQELRSALKYPYDFVEHQNNVPLDHPFPEMDREDILAVPGPATQYKQVPGRTDYRDVPFTRVVSLVECKPRSQNGCAQTASYAYQLLQARLDMVGVYVLWARPENYQILWSDASGVIASQLFKWDNLSPLRQYVWSLYVPHESHTLFDPSISLQSRNPLRWSIRINGNTVLENLKRIFIGASWGRRTNVLAPDSPSSESVVVVKESFRDQLRYYCEENAIEDIHENGTFPGVVRLLIPSEETVVDDVLTAHGGENSPEREWRIKTRFVMGSTGKELLQAMTVLDILMAFYDIVEIHRQLVERYNILHRDMSYYNILMYPRHDPRTCEKPLTKDPPVFIRQILAGEKDSQGIDRSSGLLIDFDNYANFEVDEEEAQRLLTHRTGTPMFIARSVAERIIRGIASHQPYQRMPLLWERKARELYQAAYGNDEWKKFTDAPETIHGVDISESNQQSMPGPQNSEVPDVQDLDAFIKSAQNVKKQPGQASKRKPFQHLPEHDVESLFWVLLYTLIQANPVSCSKVNKKSKEAYWKMLEAFENHRIDDTQLVDSRSGVFSTPEDELRKMLHPDLGVLSGMLYQMAQQIYPEYGHLPTAPNPVHLHEVMRRLLLDQIVKMEKKPIPLTVGEPRPPRPDEDSKLEKLRARSTTSAKRKHGTEKLDREKMPQHLPKRRK